MAAFEDGLTEASGAAHAVAVSSGSGALQLGMAALGVGPGSIVITSANTFLASATAALWCGAEVEFVDIDPDTLNFDLDALEARLARGPVDAVVAVHFAGLPCDMERLANLKRRFGFKLVEDACHAFGGSFAYGDGMLRVGELADVDATILSFHPVKLLTTGEGGAVLTHDADVAARVRQLRHHGLVRDSAARPFASSTDCPPWFSPMSELGGNFRLSDLGAALGSSQLTRLAASIASRREQAQRYDDAFEQGRLPGLMPPPRQTGHAWHLYVLRCEHDERDALMAYLDERRIGTQLHYYPVPMQPYFSERYGTVSVPQAERHARRALSIPLYPGLALSDQVRVIQALEEWCKERGQG
ncbi:MAG: dTDP-4-amino-4,6-dideoxygalactose transaminase [Gammaproteobacteria bacterium]